MMKKEFKPNIAKEEETQNYSYYSNLLKKVFSTKEEMFKEENKYREENKKQLELQQVKRDESKAIKDAYEQYLKVVEESNKKILDAKNEYLKLRSDWIKKYGSFHMTYTSDDKDITLNDVLASWLDVFRLF